MSTESKSRSEAYSSTRSAFDELGMEEKACFLLESTAKAVADGVQEAVVAFSDMFGGAFSEAFNAAREAQAAGEEGAAKPSGKKKAADASPKSKTTKSSSAKAKTAKPKAKSAKTAKPKSDTKE
ncbi:hypothetical protein HQ496_09125 [bacterium]|nr:hypothetical protein [bacterium]